MEIPGSRFRCRLPPAGKIVAQSGKLAHMGGEDHRAAAAAQNILMRVQNIYAVRIQNHWAAGQQEKLRDQLKQRLALPAPGADEHAAAPGGSA